jgi:hypothetical protein
MPKLSVVPAFASLAVGVNEYDAPAATVVGGEPEITGAAFVTVIENAASDTDACPSLTLITMSEYVPVCAVAGAPCSRPVLPSNVAHGGAWLMLKLSVVSGFGSLAVGVNEYDVPAATVVAGVPEMSGAVFITVIENASNDVDARPSLTLITTPSVVPISAAVVVPCKEPVVSLNVAHDGAFTML